MAKEDFKKFQELLRTLFLDGSAYDRQELAALLGISPHTLDKAVREIRDMIEQAAPDTFVASRGRRISFSLKHRHYESTSNFLLFLYRLKTLRIKEKSRLLQVITTLFEEPGSTIEDFMEAIDEKTIEENSRRRKQERLDHVDAVERTAVLNYLHYLEDIGVIEKKEDDTYYPIHDLYDSLSEEELRELYHYVDYKANTSLLSVPGYLLADTLRNQLTYTHDCDLIDDVLYRYNHFGRILDEYICEYLLELIAKRCQASFQYYGSKKEIRYRARNTNPLYAKEEEPRLSAVPLRIVHDHQYGRWYLLAAEYPSGHLHRMLIENIMDIMPGEPVPEDWFLSCLTRAEEELDISWSVSGGKPKKVRIKFYFDSASGTFNFIRERVRREGQHGVIVEEGDGFFMYEITVSEVNDMKPWIRSFGSSAEVLAPDKLRQEIKQEWEALRHEYDVF